MKVLVLFKVRLGESAKKKKDKKGKMLCFLLTSFSGKMYFPKINKTTHKQQQQKMNNE